MKHFLPSRAFAPEIAVPAPSGSPPCQPCDPVPPDTAGSAEPSRTVLALDSRFRGPTLRLSILWFAVLAVLTISGCSDHPATTGPAAGRGGAAVTVEGGVQKSTGTYGRGALHAFFVPERWNRTLVLYAHGFVDPAEPIALPTQDGIEPLRDELLDRGFAVGYSSFSSNGFAEKEGMLETAQLRGLFTSQFGRPDRVLLAGHSLGGLIAVHLIEKYPKHYAGALAMCGLIGGTKATVDYLGDLRVLFDLFHPGLLPGTVEHVPPGVDLNEDVIAPVVGAVSSDPTGAFVISRVDQTPVPFASGPQLVESFVRGIGFLYRGLDDLKERSHGHFPYGNAETVYTDTAHTGTGGLPASTLAFINENVARVTADRDALNEIDHFYEPSGRLSRPVLTLHNPLDPVAPVLHEDRYREKVAEADASRFLVQRVSSTRYGHCELPVPEMVTNFEDLVSWVETGVRP